MLSEKHSAHQPLFNVIPRYGNGGALPERSKVVRQPLILLCSLQVE
jgi:hypothetical protein